MEIHIGTLPSTQSQERWNSPPPRNAFCQSHCARWLSYRPAKTSRGPEACSRVGLARDHCRSYSPRYRTYMCVSNAQSLTPIPSEHNYNQCAEHLHYSLMNHVAISSHFDIFFNIVIDSSRKVFTQIHNQTLDIRAHALQQHRTFTQFQWARKATCSL